MDPIIIFIYRQDLTDLLDFFCSLFPGLPRHSAVLPGGRRDEPKNTQLPLAKHPAMYDMNLSGAACHFPVLSDFTGTACRIRHEPKQVLYKALECFFTGEKIH
jgi:hypothetical protein